MIKKTIVYKEADGEERVEEHYFHMTVKQVVVLQGESPGGLETMITEMLKADDVPGIMGKLNLMITRSHGTRTEDGRFVRDSTEAAATFEDSLAFDALIVELITHPESISGFIRGILPADLADKIDEMTPPEIPKELPWAHRKPTPEELRNMTKEQLIDVMRRDSRPASQE